MYLFTFLSKDYLAPYLCKYMASLKCNYSYSDYRVCHGISLCISQIIKWSWTMFHGYGTIGQNLLWSAWFLPIFKTGLSFSYWFGVLYTSSGSDGKESACNVGDLGLIPGLGRSPGGGHGNPLQYSCLEKPHGQKGLVGCSPWGCKELDTTEQLSARAHTHPSKYKPFTDYIFSKYLPLWACFHSLNDIFWWMEILNFNVIPSVFL